jgi:hypothetical protein
MDVQFEINGKLVPIEELEAELDAPTIVQTLRRVIDRLESQDRNIVCDDHQVAPAITIASNPTGIGLRVSGCCQPFVDAFQANLRGLLTAMQPSSDNLVGLNLVISLVDQNKRYEFEVARIDKLFIGRVDPDTGERPDIDLSAYGAYENGVSRRHAAVLRWYHGLFLTDEGSPNGTYLNERRLLPHLPYMLKFGDKIRIGRLILDVKLDYPQGANT